MPQSAPITPTAYPANPSTATLGQLASPIRVGFEEPFNEELELLAALERVGV